MGGGCMKKRKLTKKQFKNLTIFFSALSIYWIIQAVEYAYDYEAICQVTSYALFFLVTEIIRAICMAVLTIVMIVQYTKYDEQNKDTDA